LFSVDGGNLSQGQQSGTFAGPTLQVKESTMNLVENGVKLQLTLIDTPGFGDALDNSKCWEPIVRHVDGKFAEYYAEETKLIRKGPIPDKRVHCCLYFIQPTGRSLKPLDIQFMKQLSGRANIIPVIAKADTMTAEERQAFKHTVAKEIRDNNIRIYTFPDDKPEQKQFTDRAPFAIIGSDTIFEKGPGKLVRGRKYSWGVVEVENLDHNDFVALRHLIIENHMIDLIEMTAAVHYETYRIQKLSFEAFEGLNIDVATLTVAEFDEIVEREQQKHLKKLNEKYEKEYQEIVAPMEARVKSLEEELAGQRLAHDRSKTDMRRRLAAKVEERNRLRAELDQSASTSGASGESKKGDLKKCESDKTLNNESFGSKGSRHSKSSTLSSVFRGKGGQQ